MKLKKLRVLAIIMIVITLSVVGSYAADSESAGITKYTVPRPTMTFDGTLALCKTMIMASGQTIDAILARLLLIHFL